MGQIPSPFSGSEEVKEEVVQETTEQVDAVNTETNDAQSTEITEETKQEENKVETPDFDISSLNSKFETNFESEDDFKSVLDLPSKYSELEEKYKSIETDYNTYKEKIGDIEKYLDPKEYFGGDESLYRLAQIKSKYPDLDYAVAVNIDNTDLESASPFDLYALNMKMEVPTFNGDMASVKRVMAKELGIEVEDLNDLNSLAQESPEASFMLQKKVSDIQKKLSEVKKVEGAKPIDLEARKAEFKEQRTAEIAERKEKWNPVVQKLARDFKEVKVERKNSEGELETLQSFKVDENFATQFVEEAISDLAESGAKITEETIKAVHQEMRNEYVAKNFDKLMVAAHNEWESKKIESDHQELHNAKEQNTTEAPAVSDTYVSEAQRRWGASKI